MQKLYPLINPTMEVQFDANVVNKYFADVCTRDMSIPQPILPCKPALLGENVTKFKFQTITCETLKNAWKQIKNKKSSSTDYLGICNSMINFCMKSPFFVSEMAKLFNVYVESGSLPDRLKLSKVIPIPKKSNPTTCNDLRPISIQPVLSKLFAKCIYEQLYNYFESNNMFLIYQFGGRKCHSTTHALIALTDYVYKSLDNNMFCILIALDIKKAYDRCDKEVLLHKLRWYGIDENIINSFLSDRKQFVCLRCKNGCHTSDTLPTNVGVAQGLCLSCFLFLVMMNDLPLCIKNSLCIKFVDDTGIIISGELCNIARIVDMIENDLVNICTWMKSKRLELNNDKCEMMMICNKKSVKYVEDVVVNLEGKLMKKVKHIKMLGVCIDYELKFKLHCEKVTEKCNYALWSLNPLKCILDIKHKIIVVQALVMSIIKYACPVWLVGSNNLKCVDNIIRKCARFIYNKSKFDNISDEINVDLEWLNATNCCKFEIIKLAVNMNNNVCPKYFYQYLCHDEREIRSTRRSDYVEPNILYHNGIMKKSFLFRASKLWLNLPVVISEKSNNMSMIEFKKQVKDMLLNVQRTDRIIELFEIIDNHEMT